MTQPLIELQQVTYAYPRSSEAGRRSSAPVPVLRGVDLQIHQGEYLALLGHNGSGKSTLARLCNALLLPDSGRVLVAGMDTSDLVKQPLIREQIGMIFQNPDNQLIATVVEDDIAWSLTVQGWPLTAIRERVEAALQAVSITHLRYELPHKLSGGQRQRVAIAGILALRPRCIIADEATAALDPLTRYEITRLLYQLHQEHGITIIHVTHLLEEVTQAQRVIVMEQGQVVREGTPAAIFADLEYLRSLKLAIPEPLILADRLRAAGISISQDALTVAAIARELAQ